MSALATVLTRAGACAALSAAVAWLFGPVPAMTTAAVWGLALARPLYELVGEAVHATRAAALADVEGRHFAHAGFPIEVIEDDEARWLRAAQVQRVLADPAEESAFARRFGPTGSRAGARGRWYVRDEALVDYLQRSSRAMDARRNGLRLFVEREVIGPHRRARDRGAP